MRRAASGQAVCVTVTALDGIIVARSAFESSFRYRSAVLGAFTPVPESGKRSALETLSERMPSRAVRGSARAARSRDRGHAGAEDADQRVVDEGARRWPTDNDDDVAGTCGARVIPLLVARHGSRPCPRRTCCPESRVPHP